MKMTDEVIWTQELVKMFGWRRAAELMGSAVVFAVLGETAETLDSQPTKPTRWRVRRDLKRFGVHMRELGYWDDRELTPNDVRMKISLAA
jgi:hypothetical protein